ncbi:RNA polymerase sigma factor [Streptomyces sp. NBC_01497]|uniref:RNA polymerase sigma factor n=1 Tax=Streptomyces sp. NBC_01497 TaxID=2903885 RepID=UPI002E330A00|nr:RNA polymerase sigma factor [Streptomyces sp. NBC_01497]
MHSIDSNATDWADVLKEGNPRYELACRQLHALLLRIALGEAFRRGPAYRIYGPELTDLAHQAAADALMRIIAKVDGFRGDSQFTTWAFKFVVLEISTKLGRHHWRKKRVAFDLDQWIGLPDRPGFDPAGEVEARELLVALRRAVETVLSERQRRIFTALIVNGDPVDALIDELDTNRNAVYKCMFDARKKLRARLVADGHIAPQPRLL